MEYCTTHWSGKLTEEAIVFELHSLCAWLLKMTDGRKRRGIRYPLALMVIMVILATLGGKDGPKGWLSDFATGSIFRSAT